MSYLVDTCVLSEVAKTKPADTVLRWFAATDEGSMAISALTIGEIRFGIARLPASAKRRRLTAWLSALEARFEPRIVPVDGAVAATWGELRAQALARGRPLAAVDGLLAATAATHGLTFVTRNVADVRATGVPVLDPWTS